MALNIVAGCVNCCACQRVCPNQAISAGKPHFLIIRKKCDECVGDYLAPLCAAICPIEGAILDDHGQALNPPGSLTGIPPERWPAAQAEIAAR